MGVRAIVGRPRRGPLRSLRSHTPPGEGNGVLLLSGTVVLDLERLEDFPDEEPLLSLEESEGRDPEDRALSL